MSRVLVMSVGADAIDARAIVDGHVDRAGTIASIDGRFDPDSLRAVVRDVVWHGVDIAGVARRRSSAGPADEARTGSGAAGAADNEADSDAGTDGAHAGPGARGDAVHDGPLSAGGPPSDRSTAHAGSPPTGPGQADSPTDGESVPGSRLDWVARVLRQQLPMTPVLVRGEPVERPRLATAPR